MFETNVGCTVLSETHGCHFILRFLGRVLGRGRPDDPKGSLIGFPRDRQANLSPKLLPPGQKQKTTSYSELRSRENHWP